MKKMRNAMPPYRMEARIAQKYLQRVARGGIALQYAAHIAPKCLKHNTYQSVFHPNKKKFVYLF